MNKIDSIEKVIVPFRAPEIHNDIINFPMEEYFYFDQEWDIEKRFKVYDNFKHTFEKWSNINLPQFNFYPVNGSTEAITQSLIDLSYTKKKIALFENEYSYYSYIASKYNIKIVWVNSIDDLTDECVFVTSLPFCRDGKIHKIQENLLKKCEDENIECWIDCAYYGAGRPVDIDIPLTATNVFFSFSKNFGLGLNRIGIWFSKKTIEDKKILNYFAYFPYGNMSLITMLMKKYPKDFLWTEYRDTQLKCSTNPSDIIFMDGNKCITNIINKAVKEKFHRL